MGNIIQILFVMLKCINIVTGFAIDSVTDYKKGHSKGYCRDGFCGSTSYGNMRRNFKGLFLSSLDISLLDRVMNNAALADSLTKAQPLSNTSVFSDVGASCCSTQVQHILKTEMTNVEGVTKSIFHLSDDVEPTYQYIPHASCVQTGSCPGECVAEGKILFLLSWHAKDGMKFDPFEVPGYCSCKKFGTAKRLLQR